MSLQIQKIEAELARLRAEEASLASHFGWSSEEAQAKAKEVRELELYLHQLWETAYADY